MSRFLVGTRYLILIPILGLAIAAASFFIFGGIGLVQLIFELIFYSAENTHLSAEGGQGLIIFEVVEFVHTFLVGTVLYITAVGLYQLFIQELDFPKWLKIDSTEELEMNLIGVTVVVLAVNFLTIVYTKDASVLFEYGAGIALPIAALAFFVGMRTWSTHLAKKSEQAEIENE